MLVYKRARGGDAFYLFEKVPVPVDDGPGASAGTPVVYPGRGTEGGAAVARSFALTLVNSLIGNAGAKCVRRNVVIEGSAR